MIVLDFNALIYRMSMEVVSFFAKSGENVAVPWGRVVWGAKYLRDASANQLSVPKYIAIAIRKVPPPLGLFGVQNFSAMQIQIECSVPKKLQLLRFVGAGLG